MHIQNLENNSKEVHERWNTKIKIIKIVYTVNSIVQFLLFILVNEKSGYACGILSGSPYPMVEF